MAYENLRGLIAGSSSTRAYFLSLPVELQLALHEQDAVIRTAAELRRRAAALEDYRRHVRLSGGQP